jgi:hypothetical protein
MFGGSCSLKGGYRINRKRTKRTKRTKGFKNIKKKAVVTEVLVVL